LPDSYAQWERETRQLIASVNRLLGLAIYVWSWGWKSGVIVESECDASVGLLR
jgi:hypothetical protein